MREHLLDDLNAGRASWRLTLANLHPDLRDIAHMSRCYGEAESLAVFSLVYVLPNQCFGKNYWIK